MENHLALAREHLQTWEKFLAEEHLPSWESTPEQLRALALAASFLFGLDPFTF